LILGWPQGKNEILFTAFQNQELSINEIHLLGSNQKIHWNFDEAGLKVSLPEEKVDDIAIVYKIEVSEQ
jgi:hypothetical protein